MLQGRRTRCDLGFSVGLIVVLLAGAIINHATLGGPLALDDYAQRAMIEGSLTAHRGPLNLYDFVDDSNRASLMERGALPWWTDSGLKIRFFRPLASALIWLDHRLFGYDPFVPHVLSLCWWAAATLSVGFLFRRVLAPVAALVATAVFALSPCHAIPLVWLANRNVLVALVFGSLALRAYLEWRAEPRPLNAFKTGLLFLASLLSGEYAFSFVGYVLAIESVQLGQSVRRRMVGFLPVAIPAVSVAVFATLLQYGTRFSGFYKHPVSDFGEFADRAPSKLTSMLGSAWFGFGDNWLSSRYLVWVGLLAATFVVAVVWIRSRFGSVHRESAIWLLGGSVLAGIPLLGAQPSWRLLAPIMVGVAGVVGFVIGEFVTSLKVRRRLLLSTPLAAVGAVLVYVHLLGAPFEAHAQAKQALGAERDFDERFRRVLERDQPATSMVLLLRAYLPPSVLWTPFLFQEKAPARWFAVGLNSAEIVVVRTGARALDVEVRDGPLVPCGPYDLFNTRGMTVGQTIEQLGSRATVLATDSNACPSHVKFEFDRDLDDGAISWLVEERGGFQEIVRPGVGVGVKLTP